MKNSKALRRITRNSPIHIRIFIPSPDQLDRVKWESDRIVNKMF